MEKMTIEKFKEYCKFTQELYELLKDESKLDEMSPEEGEKLEARMEELVEALRISDLSDIPFEAWEDFVLVIQDLNLENTGANIDFNLITIPQEMRGYTVEVNLKGCNVRNFNFDKTMFRYTEASFDPEFVAEAIAQNGTLFPESKITNQDVKERLRLGRITLQDIKEYDMKDFITPSDMEYHTKHIIETIGLDKALEVDDEIINDEELFERFYREISRSEEYDLEEVKKRIFEKIAEDCFGYSSKSTYERFENNPYVTSQLPEIFVDFPEGTDEELKDAYKSKELRVEQLVDNYELFKGKKVLARLIDNGYYGLNERYPEISDEKLGYVIESFPDIVEIYKIDPHFIYKVANEIDMTQDIETARESIIESIKEKVLKEGVKDERVLSILPYKDIALQLAGESYTSECKRNIRR